MKTSVSEFTFGFIGLGLMGGSLARAIRKYVLNQGASSGKILACDIHKASLEDALLDGVIDKGFSYSDVSQMIPECDIIFVCLYPKATLSFLLEHEQLFSPHSIITDIAGVKSPLIAKLSNTWKREDVVFLPAHPMAGSEREGFAHASSEIFKGRNYLFLPPIGGSEKIEMQGCHLLSQWAIKSLKEIALSIGFSRLIDTTAKVHDHKIAFTSQLCHIIASALVDSAEDTEITAFGGGSFEDLTRIAMINAPLWTELFLEDREELLFHITSFEKSMAMLRKTLEEKDDAGLEKILANVREKRIFMAKLKNL
jgi:prephenate dehydrogenase